jgi:oligopeptide transport system substrate-binding protein
MSKGFKFSSVFAVLLALSLVLSACNFGSNSGSDDGKTLNLIELQEPPSLDSAKATDSVSFTILDNVLEGLYRADGKDQPVLAMAAEEPKVSDDQKTWTFKIRDAKWSDDKPVTAKDFEYSWKRVLDPKTASEYVQMMYVLENAEEYNTGKAKVEDVGVKALDDKTLEVKLKTAIPYFKALLTFPTFLPQRQDIVEKYGDKYALEAKNMVYNGAFVLSDWKHEKSFQYKKNDLYWDKANVKLNTVNVNIVKDSSQAINLYETGKTDFAYLGAEFLDKYKSSKEKFVIEESSVWYLEFNQREKEFFKNSKIRQAFSLAIDRQKLIDSVLKNGSTLPSGFVHSAIYATPDKKYRDIVKYDFPFDPAKAKQLLAEGLKEIGMDKAPTVELLTDDTTKAKRQAEFFKEQFRVNLGVNVEIASVTFKERLNRGKNGKFDIVIGGWGADYNDPLTYLTIMKSDESYNRGKWKNDEYDKLIRAATVNENYEERLEQLKQAEKILMDETGIAMLYFRNQLGLKKDYVKNWPWRVIGAQYSLKEVSIEGKK